MDVCIRSCVNLYIADILKNNYVSFEIICSLRDGNFQRKKKRLLAYATSKHNVNNEKLRIILTFDNNSARTTISRLWFTTEPDNECTDINHSNQIVNNAERMAVKLHIFFY